MTSTIVPPVDLAPGMPSRVVTISATDVTEGGTSLEGQMVRFALSDTLDVSSGGDVIAKTQAEVVLDEDGNGSIRLPVYDEDVKTWCGKEWAILVTATWGSQKAIRVPAGTSSIALSALPPVRPLRGRELQWAVTGVSVSVTEGGSWDASLDLSGGILNLGLTVPPGGTAWYKGRLADGTNVDDMWRTTDNGIYELVPSGGYSNLPPGVAGASAQLRVESRGAVGTQEVVQYGSSRIWRRNMSDSTISPRGWLEWRRIEADAAVVDQLESDVGSAFLRRGPLADGTALSTLTSRFDSGLWIIGASSTYPDLPEVIGTRQTAELMNFPSGSGGTFQMITFRYNQGTFWRVQTGVQGVFSDWLPLGGGSQPETAPDVLGRLELLEAATPLATTFESTRIFTSYEAGEAYLDRLAAAHPDRATILDLGESRQGRPIRAMRMGDPTMPTFYVIASQHGDEPMGRECAYQWLHEMLTRPDFDTIMDGICVVVTPVVNVDRINVQRLSSSGTDLNGNWPTEGTSEITAAASVLKTHDVVLTMDAHEGGLWETMQAAVANAPEVAESLRLMSQDLYAHIEQVYTTAGEAFAAFPGSQNLSQARNVIAERYHSSTILFEGSSDLHNGMYSPDVVYRERVYMLAYRSVFEHFRDNLPDYVAAKVAAQA